MSDPVNHPPHYGEGAYEAIKVIEAWELGFCLGNAVKYICRAGKKHPDRIEDLRKAAWYLQREIAQLTSSSNAAVIEKVSWPEDMLNIPTDMRLPPPPPPRPPLREGAKTPFAEGVLVRLTAIEQEMERRKPFSLHERLRAVEKAVEPLPAIVKWFRSWTGIQV